MPHRRAPVLVSAAAAMALASCTAVPPGETPPTSSADYQRAYAIALEAYVYGLPLLTTDATYRTMTSVEVSQGAFGPVNQFNNVRSPNNAGSTAVVAPGATSLSSIAWLDLAAEPQVLHVPEVTDHFFVLALIDPYTENVVNLGTASGTAAGDYVIETPDQKGALIPSGSHRIQVDYSRIWVIGSTQLRGPSDIAAVNRIQDGYTLTPLSEYGARMTPTPPADPVTTVTHHAPATGIAFFDQLGSLLEQFPPPAATRHRSRGSPRWGSGPAGRRPPTAH